MQIQRPVQVPECLIELTRGTVEHRALQRDCTSGVQWNVLQHASGQPHMALYCVCLPQVGGQPRQLR